MLGTEILGLHWSEAEEILQKMQQAYQLTQTKHKQNRIFAVDESRLYVVRVTELDDGSWQVTLAAKMVKQDSK